MSDAAPRAGHVVSFIDIGTNSVRMMVVRLNPNLSYTVLSQEKEMVRLGAGGFDDMFLRRDAIDRTVLVCRKFVELSRYYGADEIIAVATSAAREAGNQNVLVERLREDVGVELGIISGIEEARLVFLGVASGLELADRTALMIDIGGGSTELALGTGRGHEYLDSLKLGAIRMTDLFIPRGHQGAVSEKTYAAMKKHVRGYMSQATRCIRKSHTDVAIGSSGTIVNLSEMAVRSLGGQPGTLRLSHLRKLASTIRSFTLKERRMLPGINPERADIIIGGAAVLEAIMEELRIDELRVSERGVREGLLVDYLARIEGSPHAQGKGVRETSILQLGRSCDVDEGHAATVERLSLSLFDSARSAGLHNLGDKERELLRYAAYLHDVGDFISFTNHHFHSYYIIRNADLLGFDQKEVAIMAALARYHRKKAPRRKDPELAGLDQKTYEAVATMSAFVRLAESLDRSHGGVVEKASLKRTNGEVILELISDGDPSLEVWGLEGAEKAFRRVFGLDLTVKLREKS